MIFLQVCSNNITINEKDIESILLFANEILEKIKKEHHIFKGTNFKTNIYDHLGFNGKKTIQEDWNFAYDWFDDTITDAQVQLIETLIKAGINAKLNNKSKQFIHDIFSEINKIANHKFRVYNFIKEFINTHYNIGCMIEHIMNSKDDSNIIVKLTERNFKNVVDKYNNEYRKINNGGFVKNNKAYFLDSNHHLTYEEK